MTRFEMELNDHIVHGADFLIFKIKCKTKDRYIYTIESIRVDRKVEKDDLVVDYGKEMLTNSEFFAKCMSALETPIMSLYNNLKNTSMIFLNNEMRFINKDYISSIWTDICCE